MSSRDDILARVRAGLGKGDRAARRAAAEASLARPVRGPQPNPASDPVDRFCTRAASLASTVARLAHRNEVPTAVGAYLDGLGLPPTATVSPELAAFDWPGAGLRVDARGAIDSDLVGITGCFCAVAETGTLVLLSSPASPPSVSLLPETHIAVVAAPRILATMEDAYALIRQELGSLPRAVNFVSGPSRTGDIEQTIVLGAHGPCRVHILVLESDPRTPRDSSW